MTATPAQLGLRFVFDIGLDFLLRHPRHPCDTSGFSRPVQALAGTSRSASSACCSGLLLLAVSLVGSTLALSSTAVVAGLIAERATSAELSRRPPPTVILSGSSRT